MNDIQDFDALQAQLNSQYTGRNDQRSKDSLTLVSRLLEPLFGSAQVTFSQGNNFDAGAYEVIVRGNFNNIGFDTLSDNLQKLTGQTSWKDQFPTEFRDVIQNIPFSLNEASVRMVLGDSGVDVAFVDFQVGFTCPPCEIMKSLSIGLNTVSFFINDPLNASGSRRVWAIFDGNLTVMGLPFSVRIQGPEYSIFADYCGGGTPDIFNKATGQSAGSAAKGDNGAKLPAPPTAGFNLIRLSAVLGSYYSFLLDANAPLSWLVQGENQPVLLHVNASLYYNVQQSANAQGSGFPITGWHFEADAEQGIPIQGLLARLAAEVQGLPTLSAPSSINEFSVLGFSLSYDIPSKDFQLSATGMLGLGEGKTLTAKLEVHIAHQQDGTYDDFFSGVLTFMLSDGTQLEFDLVFESKDETKTFLALYRDLSTTPLPVKELVALASPTIGDKIPQSFSLTIKQALYAYLNADTPKHLFGIEIDGGINLSDIRLPGLPLVGTGLLPPDQKLELAFRLLAASDTFDQEEIAGLEALVSSGLGLPPDKIENVAVQAALRLGTETRQLNLPVAGLAKSKGLSGDDAQSLTPPSQVTAVSADSVQWISIQKSFGPVHFERVGLKVDDTNIGAVLDASLGAGPLSIGLSGLRMDCPIDHLQPNFSLDGLSIDFRRDELEIGGSFLRQELQRKNKETGGVEKYTAYGGMAVIRTGKLTISAIGSYSTHSGQPSLFIYAVLDYPIGGPSFFFVTGLAAGFGFNRALVMPEIDDVETFPLVEQVRRGNQPALAGGSAVDQQAALLKALAALENYVPPEIGEYFLAVGIHFTSFKIVDSFALLAVQFGHQLEIDLLGSSILIAPAGVGATTPVAQAKLALKARYVPDDGTLTVLGKISPDSYIFSQKCHLQGGFAFYAWFAKEHAGDFVLTLGGYHPQYKKPSHYPDVPRLGFNWQVSDKLSMKGEGYFALTPYAIMVGGNLEALWHDGPVRAWFKAGIDCLLNWQPYHYDARAYVSIGASYTVESFLGNSTISAELGADVHVWGPDFALTADVHYYIFSVHIEYNPNPQPNKPLTWASFQQAFLPSPDQICGVTVLSGLLHQTGSGKDTNWVMDFRAPAFTINTTIPANLVQFGPDQTRLNFHSDGLPIYFVDKERTVPKPFLFDPAKPQDAPTQTKTLFTKVVGQPGIQPLSVSPGAFDSRLVIQITRTEGSITKNIENEFTFVPILKTVPPAMWGEPLKSPPDNPNPQAKLVADTLAGFELRPAGSPQSASSRAISADKLRSSAKQSDMTVQWENTTVVLQTKNGDSTVVDQTITEQATSDRRDSVLQSLGMSAYRLDFSHAPSSGMVSSPAIESATGSQA